MKEKALGLLGVLCISTLFCTVANAKGKLDKPGPRPLRAEWISFTGDLEGNQIVEGCCPNAGPFSTYSMTLSGELCEKAGYCGTFEGQLFINGYRVGHDHRYIVQFWNDEIGLAIEIIGGVIDIDRKTKILTVTFENEECVDLYTKEYIGYVSFVLERIPLQ